MVDRVSMLKAILEIAGDVMKKGMSELETLYDQSVEGTRVSKNRMSDLRVELENEEVNLQKQYATLAFCRLAMAATRNPNAPSIELDKFVKALDSVLKDAQGSFS
jgi:hypothetical protein